MSTSRLLTSFRGGMTVGTTNSKVRIYAHTAQVRNWTSHLVIATCKCGWIGPVRPTLAEAKVDIETHYEEAVRVPEEKKA